jgi:Cupin-like domain
MKTAGSVTRRTPYWFTAGADALARPVGWVATALYVGWQVVVEQKLFLHTFLVKRMGRRGVPTLPMGYGNVLVLKGIMLWRQVSGRSDALQPAWQRAYSRIHRRLQERGLPKDSVQPIAEYLPGQITPERFYKQHVKHGVPCVLRGFAGADVSQWRLAALADRFPDAVAQVLDKRAHKMISVSLRVIHEDGRRNYIPQQLLLDQNPVLHDHFEVDRSNGYFRVMGRPSKPVLSFLILGLGAGLNANWHCEESPNWYLAVSGSKRWSLIEAEYSWLLYPSARGDGMRRFADFAADNQGSPRDALAYPLVAYAPRYEFELHPGDVLFFPAWMWHKTINLNDEGLGVTCRYTAPTAMSNRYFRALQLLSGSFWRTSVQVVSSMIRGDVADLADDTGPNEQEVALYN